MSKMLNRALRKFLVIACMVVLAVGLGFYNRSQTTKYLTVDLKNVCWQSNCLTKQDEVWSKHGILYIQKPTDALTVLDTVQEQKIEWLILGRNFVIDQRWFIPEKGVIIQQKKGSKKITDWAQRNQVPLLYFKDIVRYQIKDQNLWQQKR